MKALIFHNHNHKLLTLGAPWDHRLIILAIWTFLEHYMAIIITTNESNFYFTNLNLKGTELGMVVYAYNPGTWDAETVSSGVQGQPQLVSSRLALNYYITLSQMNHPTSQKSKILPDFYKSSSI